MVIEPPESGKLTGTTLDESPLYVVMSRNDELASFPSLRFEHLSGRGWMMFQRSAHPPLYDLIHSCAQDAKAIPNAIQHFMVPKETIPMLMSPDGIVIAPKSGALRIARDGYTMRHIEEERLRMKTLLISRSDNASPALSELVRGFMRKMNRLKNIHNFQIDGTGCFALRTGDHACCNDFEIDPINSNRVPTNSALVNVIPHHMSNDSRRVGANSHPSAALRPEKLK